MHRSLLPLVLLATGLPAQGLVPPATLRAFQKQNGLSTPAVPGADVEQIHVVKLPGDPAGVYTVGLTVATLPAANGGVGGQDLLTGKYNVFTDTFTPDLNAAGLNGAGTDFGFSMHSSGLIAVWDRLSTVEVATRPNVTAPWVRKGSVTGITGVGYFDPSLATLNGQLVLLFVTGAAGNANVAYAPLDINTLAAGPATIIIKPNRGSGEANSPTPIVTSTGELVAVSHHDVVGSDNDHYMSMDLDPATPSVLFVDNPNWKNNGGFAAGIFYEAHSVAPYHIISTEAAWWTGGRAAIGTNMEITANVVPKATGVPSISFALLSNGFLPTPTPIGGVTGLLGVNPTFLIIVSLGAHTITTGQATISLGVPNDPSLKGVVIPAQSLTIDLTPPTQLILGNTAALTILP